MKNSIINRRFRYNDINACAALIIINVAVFLVSRVFPRFPYYISLIPAYVKYRHWYWQFFTYMFTHVDFWHLFSNMFGLYIFGRIVERNVGSKEFLLYYLLSGTLSGIAAYFIYTYTGRSYAILGASGALYSVMLLFAVLFPRAVVLLLGIIPMRAPILVLLYFLIDFLSFGNGDGVAHAVHLSGLAVGVVYISVRMRMNILKQWGII